MFGRKKQTDTDTPAKPSTLSQLRQAYVATKATDPRVGPLTFAIFAGVVAVFVLVGLLVGHPWLFLAIGVPLALLGAAIFFGRRAEKAAYATVAGKPGAAAAIVSSFKRGGWMVTPGVAATRQQDVLHRAVSRAGIVMLGEGDPARVATLFSQERKRVGRIVPEVPIHDMLIGDGEGQVALGKLQRELMRLPKLLTDAQAVETDKRLKAVGSLAMPMPKGPVGRQPRSPRGMR